MFSFAKTLKESLRFWPRLVGASMEERGKAAGHWKVVNEDDCWGERGDSINTPPQLSQLADRQSK